jgi:RecA-family ATPase
VSILTQNEAFTQSQAIALQLIKSAPNALFCTFSSQKIPYKRTGQGVARDTPANDLYTADDIWAMEAIPHGQGQHIGLVQQAPILQNGSYLVCLDVDMKRSDGPTHQSIKAMAKDVKSKGMLTEVSVSGKGRHIFVWANALPTIDQILPKYKLGNGQEVEVFGLPNSAGKSVLLSGNALVGSLGEPVDLYQLLTDWGITAQHAVNAPPPPTAATPPPMTQYPATSPSDDFQRALEALQHISPDCDYDQWIELGQALHTAFGDQGRSAWANWSAAGSKFKGDADIEAHWKSFHQGKGVGIGTLFKYAKDNGWTPQTKQSQRLSAVEDFANIIKQGLPSEPSTGSPDEPFAIESPAWPERQLSIGTLKPIRYLIKGFWAHSFMVLAGQPGIGKTTAVISLCLVMSGISNCELTATRKRKTIIVTEDSDQVERTLTGYCRHYGIKAQDINDWFVIIDARRSAVQDLLLLATNVIAHTVGNIRPLLVLDTANSTMDIDNENDNSEVGAFIAALKQTIYIQLDTPMCIITHTNKTISKSDSDATARGASAFTGDATLTGVLFEDETKTRYMRLVKTRYQPNFREIKFTSEVFADAVMDEDHQMQEQMVLLVTPSMSSEDERKQAASTRKDEKQEQKILDACDEVCSYIQSIINNHPEGVIMRRGAGRPSIPKEFNQMHQLEWSTVYQAVPRADQGHSRRAVGAAIFQRFAKDHQGLGWVKLF